MDIKEIFKKELTYIKDDSLRESLEAILNKLPEYFYEVPASSTGKYHPAFSLGDGGLLRHSKLAMRIGFELLNDPAIGDKYKTKEKDLMLMGLLVHDGLKSGIEQSKYTKFDHPIIMANYIIENSDEFKLSEEDANFIGDVIKTHMGPWTTDYDGNEVLEKPSTKYQNFVHMCDYIASRKFLNVEFDKDNNIVD